MKNLLIISIVLLCGPLFSQDTTKLSTRHTILEYGFASEDDYLVARNIIAEDWGIKFKSVAGCIVSTELEDSVSKLNKTTFKQIRKEYGENWKLIFDEQVKKKYDEISTQEETYIRKNKTAVETTVIKYSESKTSVLVSRIKSENNKTEEKRIETPISLINVRDSRNDILYRGFQNVFKIEIPSFSDTTNYELECINCSVSKSFGTDTLEIDYFGILPNTESESKLLIIQGKKVMAKFIFTHERLPQPELYLNGKINRSSIKFSNQKEFELTLQYPETISLTSNFIVESWHILWLDGVQREGNGKSIDLETLTILQSLEAGKQISILCDVRGEDNVLRKKGGTFTIEK